MTRPLPRRSLLPLAAAVSSALLTLYPPTPSLAQSTGNRLQGLDVSDWQGTINWSSVYNSGGKRFAFIRSSRGGTTGFYDEYDSDNSNGLNTLSQRYDDTQFVTNITNATAAGLFAGPYHFARPDIIASTKNSGGIANTGTDEANHFLQQAGNWMRPGYLLPVLDAEAGQSQRSSSALSQFFTDFSNRIQAVVGVAPIIYVSQNYANYVNSSVPAAMPVNWVARWNDQGTTGYDWHNVDWNNDNPDPVPSTANVYGKWNPDYPTIPNSQPWPGEQPWSFWQYTSVGRSPGVGNNNAAVDLDAVHGSIEYLKDFLVPALWTASASGDWSSLSNWNSDNPNYVPGNPSTGPAPRLPGPNDTVILNNALSSNSYTVTLSSGSHTIRKLYVQRALNLTGGSLTLNYVPSPDSTPFSAQFSQSVSLSGSASLSLHTLLVDHGRVFTLAGGSLTFNTLTLDNSVPVSPGHLLLTGDVTLNPLNDAAASINFSDPGSTGVNPINLAAATRTLTVGDGAAPVDLTLNVPLLNGSITKAGPGTLQLNSTASLNAPVTVSAGTLIATQNNQLGTAVNLASAGSLHLAGSLSYNLPLTLSGAGASGIAGSSGTPSSPGDPGSLHALSGSPTWSGPITLAGSGSNGTDPLINQVSAAPGSTLTLAGPISSTASGALAKSGAGDLVLSGSSPNTYTGLTRLYGGRLIVEKDAALGSPSSHTFLLANSATTLAFRSSSSLNYSAQEYIHTDGTGAPGYAQVDNLAGNNTFAGSIAFAGPADTGSVGVSAGSLTLTGGLYARTGSPSPSRTINKTGPGTLTLAGDSSLPPTSSSALPLAASTLNVTAGTVDLRSPNPASPNVPGLTAYSVSPGATLLNSAGTLSAASLSVSGTFHQSASARLQSISLTVNPGGHATLDPSPLAPSTLSSLTLIGTATLDITSNTLLLPYDSTSPADTIRSYLLTSRLTSSAADPTHRLAYLDSGSTLTVQLTLTGDTNLDGQITPDDYALLDRGLATGGSHWWQGDFNYDGAVTSADYLLIDTTYAQSYSLIPTFLSQREAQFGPQYVSTLLASVPEPAPALSSILYLLSSLSLTRRRRRRG